MQHLLFCWILYSALYWIVRFNPLDDLMRKVL